MKPEHKPTLHCAIYTRKSSEEGLEQSFNSLEAQREACEAFILSQKQEGWRVMTTRFDDGGFSGGNIERPALQHLLDEVQAGRVNVIVVYKVDRLTRSLADFAKIVETLDARGVSFVSVTQQFNTSSSMGRLTLNVLLSFAQFEREVTGERIRDKIAASKKKGMWMGGFVPLGYDLQGRKLIANARESGLVRKIFSLYLDLGCVSKLKVRLDSEHIKSKIRVSRSGTRHGGHFFSRGALYELLRNRLYLGEVRHRNQWYPGEHNGIVPLDLWEAVQQKLTSNLNERRILVGQRSSGLLAGLLVDEHNNRFTPSFTVKNGRRYRYYVSQKAIKNPGRTHFGPTRLPALEVEKTVIRRLLSFLQSEAELFEHLGRQQESPRVLRKLITGAKSFAAQWQRLGTEAQRARLTFLLRRIVVFENSLRLSLVKTNLRQALQNPREVSTAHNEKIHLSAADDIVLSVDAVLKRTGGEVHLVVPSTSQSDRMEGHSRPSLIKAVARAHGWYKKVLCGTAFDQRTLAREANLTERYIGKVFPLAILAPDIVEAILDGRQPIGLTFEKLSDNLPVSWTEQRRRLGFPLAKFSSNASFALSRFGGCKCLGSNRSVEFHLQPFQAATMKRSDTSLRDSLSH
jgi:DNA invertase Pin-like site-specific DNA recombinase